MAAAAPPPPPPDPPVRAPRRLPLTLFPSSSQVRSSARLKYLVHTLGIDKFRELVEAYYGKKIEQWQTLPPWKYLDWMGWHEQGDGKLMLGINVEQGRVADFPADHSYHPGLRLKSCLRLLVDRYDLGMTLTPSQSIVLRNIEPKTKLDIEAILREHGVKPIEEIDAITRKSIACPAFPLCGLAMTEAERAQPEINARMRAKLREMGMETVEFVTRTTGCPNGCARPYMAELALVGSGPNQYQLWLGGSPAQTRTAVMTSHFKMPLNELENYLEPIFAMYKSQRTSPEEALGDFCHRVGVPAVEEFMAGYELGSWTSLPDPFAPPKVTTDADVGIESKLLAKLGEEASARGYDAATLLDMIVREALEG